MVITDTRSDPRARRVAKVLRGLGLVLLLVGAAGYLLPAGPVHWTALIPAALGAVALAASTLARRPVVAAAVGAVLCLVALMGGGSALAQIPALLAGEAGAAVASRSATALAAIAALAALALVPWRRAA